MILFDLECLQHGHIFEAWFSSSSSFEDQRARGLLMCPTCGATDVSKAIMAPRISAKGNQSSDTVKPMMSRAEPEGSKQIEEMFGKIAKIQAESLKDSQWVGKDFERQARAMDAGDTEHAAIHGQATNEQARSMIEDGISVMPLLVPIIPPDQRN